MVGIHSHRFWSKKQGLINFMKIFTFKDYSFNIFKKKIPMKRIILLTIILK